MIKTIQLKIKNYLKSIKNHKLQYDIIINNQWACFLPDSTPSTETRTFSANLYRPSFEKTFIGGWQASLYGQSFHRKDFIYWTSVSHKSTSNIVIDDKIYSTCSGKKKNACLSETTSISAKYLDSKGLDMNALYNKSINTFKKSSYKNFCFNSNPILLCVGFRDEEVAQVRALLDYTGGFFIRVIPCSNSILYQNLSRVVKNSEPNWNQVGGTQKRQNFSFRSRVMLLTDLPTEAQLVIQGLLIYSGLSPIFTLRMSDLGGSEEILGKIVTNCLRAKELNSELDLLKKISLNDRLMINSFEKTQAKPDSMTNSSRKKDNLQFIRLNGWIKILYASAFLHSNKIHFISGAISMNYSTSLNNINHNKTNFTNALIFVIINTKHQLKRTATRKKDLKETTY